MTKTSNPVVHFEIGCRDRAQTSAFYETVFGWHITANGPSSNINTGTDRGIPGHITALGHEPHQYINIYIEVADIEASLAGIERHGGQKLIGPIELPGGQRFAWFKDVAGNTVGLITKKEL